MANKETLAGKLKLLNTQNTQKTQNTQTPGVQTDLQGSGMDAGQSAQSGNAWQKWLESMPKGGQTGGSLALGAGSGTVAQANDVLSGMIGGRAGSFTSKYEQQIADLYDQIMNRPQFTYDVNKDPLFQQYRNEYMQGGQRAMQDTMGQAAALTGGYGSSWGTTAGYQAYQQYLQALNDRIPELEQRAFDRYAYEGDQARENLNMTTDLDTRDLNIYWNQKNYELELAKFLADQGLLNGGGSGGGSSGGGGSVTVQEAPKEKAETKETTKNIWEGYPGTTSRFYDHDRKKKKQYEDEGGKG